MARFNYRASELKDASGLGGLLALFLAPFFLIFWIFKIIWYMLKGLFWLFFWPIKLFKK